MAIPAEFEWPLDPKDRKEYVKSFVTLLASEGDDTAITGAFTLPADAEAAGLEIVSQSLAANAVTAWFRVNPADQDSALFDGDGTMFRIPCLITTLADREHNRSVVLTVKRL